MRRKMIPAKVNITSTAKGSELTGQVQKALLELNHSIHSSDLARKELGTSTVEAIRTFQKQTGLPVDGRMNTQTIDKLNDELTHRFVAHNKTRTGRLQHMLQQIGYPIRTEELQSREYGTDTEKAFKEFQKKAKLKADGQVTEEAFTKLQHESLEKRFSSKTQIAELHKTLLRALHIAKLNKVRVDHNELKARQMGPSTKAAIKAVQEKYGLEATGELDPDSYEQLRSLAASVPRPPRFMKPKQAKELSRLSRTARLNMQGDRVSDAQAVLTYLNYPIVEAEYKQQTFGKTTREAVVKYQRDNHLPVTGHLDNMTLHNLNQEIELVNPDAVRKSFSHRIRGSVRNERWDGMSGIKVQVWEKQVDGNRVLLAERVTSYKGFYNIPYDPPRDEHTKQIKDSYTLQIVALNKNLEVIGDKELANPVMTTWVNFTQGNYPYRGTSVYANMMNALRKVLGNAKVSSLKETEQHRQISQAAKLAALAAEDVMHLVLAHLVSDQLADSLIGPEVCFAYISQNLPPSLPGDLLDSTAGWTEIDTLVDQTVNGLVFMESQQHSSAFEDAIVANLIPIAIILQKDNILSQLSELQRVYALEKPILVGQGSLKSLIEATPIIKPYASKVADVFLQHKGFGQEFWHDLKTNAGEFGGTAAVQQFQDVMNCGQITENFAPMLALIRGKIEDTGVKEVRSARDLAKLTTKEWTSWIHETGKQVPAHIKGKNDEERVNSYAEMLHKQSERLFPDIALITEVKHSVEKPLVHAEAIQELFDQHEELNLQAMNLDVFFKEKKIADKDLLTETRVLQRVRRIAPNATAGRALLEQKIHNAAQIVTLGKERFTDTIVNTKLVDDRTAKTMYGFAEYQYAQVLQRIADFRFELHLDDPQAIVNHKYTPEELAEELAVSPDLRSLFGSLDYCECSDCQSVYGAPAYFADLLRYLDRHNTEVAGKTVKDILFERRPDLGDMKLNCANTDSPLPYIDLVLEVLENTIKVPGHAPNVSRQTTRTTEELRAFPEHVRQEAYNVLKTADFPMDNSFHLPQEEIRAYLNHLGISRWDLMRTFQTRGSENLPSDASIAGEFWSMSTYETDLITTKVDVAAKQSAYWGFDATITQISVADLMYHSKLDYEQLVTLLQVQWCNPLTSPNPMVIERPHATCSIEEQKVVHLTVDRLDRMHRFLRLWRHTNWDMLEIDRLLRHEVLGHQEISEKTLVQLQKFSQVQERLGLSFEQAFTLYGDLDQESGSLYKQLFLNPSAGTAANEAFVLPLSGEGKLTDHQGLLLAAYALQEFELNLLLRKLGDDTLTIANLSAVSRYVFTAQGLKLDIKDLLTLESLIDTENIFATPESTLHVINIFEQIQSSNFTLAELDYLLHNKPGSPFNIRNDTITQYVHSLRENLRSNAEKAEGAMIDQIASIFSLPSEQALILLRKLTLQNIPLIVHLQNRALIAKDANGEYVTAITPTQFETLYDVYRYLHKVVVLLNKWELTTADLAWLVEHADQFHMLELSQLSPAAQSTESLFSRWLTAHKWLHFSSLYPELESTSLREIFVRAGDPASSKDGLRTEIAKLTLWEERDLAELETAFNIQAGKDHGGLPSYANIDTYFTLRECFALIKRTGASARQLLFWSKRDMDLNEEQTHISQEVKQAVKAKYDYKVWLEKVTPIEDELREKKRDALVSYLIETSLRSESPEIESRGKRYRNPAYWRVPNDLLHYYFIDVEMAACQLTSRLKQAISSTQMFVQRCLLGLEQPVIEVSRTAQQDSVSDNSWKQWKWMKNYRVWEANRKVFLYPENWIEPELRDDKTPFFKELEEGILQKEVTDENVQDAFLQYIQKVHDVSRLDIVGAYHEVDNTDPRDDLAPDINTLHVIGRTQAHPAIYYYRSFDLNYGEWTAWEKIEQDIQGEQVVPVVYNRQLYLFWMNFVDKPQKVKKRPPAQPSNNRDVHEPPNQLEIQLAWSCKTKSGWTSKRLSKQKIIHPWDRPHYTYNIKPRYKSRENLLWLDIYISQSQEFNNTRFWDAFEDLKTFVTSNRFDETSKPWHSSSFVFDGEVVDVKMKGLQGKYHVLGPLGLTSDQRRDTTSYQYVHDNFGEAGRLINRLSHYGEVAPRLPLPTGMHYHNTRLVNNKVKRNANRVTVLENGTSRTLLEGGKSPFEIVFSQHQVAFDTLQWGAMPFFYQDAHRAFFIKPEWQEIIAGQNRAIFSYKYEFYPFYHPYTALFMRELKRSGIDGLLNRRIQTEPERFYPGNTFNFNEYRTTQIAKADETVQRDIVDFARYGAYSIYNWEIFFHAPLMIACKLSANQRFEEAMRWFHYIFDPTNLEAEEVPQRYWVTRPFFEQNSEDYRRQRIIALLNNIEQHSDELKAWKNDPFKPHVIARYRPVAYQKAVVMKYIDNLIAWGDQLFRQDTIETINEASTLYVLAYELLGRRPVKVPGVPRQDQSYNELTADGSLDLFGNDKVEVLLENYTDSPVRVTRTKEGAEPLPNLDVLYFSIPNNDQMLDYWNLVEDRLFKIRNCMNIDGVVRQLPLFEPPIDPGLLVKAAASGVDISSVLSDVSAGPSLYRFERMVHKAVELCSDVRSLGEKLLTVLEKYDSEELSLLRSTQEVQLQNAITGVLSDRIQEAKDSLAGLEENKRIAEHKQQFFSNRSYMNLWEFTGVTLGGLSAAAQTGIAIGYALAGGLRFIPKISTGFAGFGGTPAGDVEIVDGEKLGQQAEAAVKTIGAIASALDKGSSLAFTMGSYDRRAEEWKYQAEQAEIEIKQLKQQILAAEVRLAITEKELDNQHLKVEQLLTADEYMRTKYTNRQLYDWHVKQLSTIYFQSYQLAYEMAKQAEQCYRFELGDPAASFIQFGYWDSLKKGLLSGERLMNDIRRMEGAYLERNNRDFEITKHVSLAQITPLSLIELKEAGSCTVTLPEWLFDMDFPGHYKRRIKSVSISIPSVVGPYTSVNCTLSLTNHGIRMNDSITGNYGDPLNGGDERFYKSPVPMTAIATSHGLDDTGMFELNFNDARFLPFEGAGAVSQWRLELPQANNQFDVSTISDVILHVRYTAKTSGNQTFIQAAQANVDQTLPKLGARLFTLNHDFGTAWQRFLHPDSDQEQTLTFELAPEHLPFYARRFGNVKLKRVDIILDTKENETYEAKLQVPGGTPTDEMMVPNSELGYRPHLSKEGFVGNVPLLGEWRIQLKKQAAGDYKSIKREDIQNAYFLVSFEA